ncbi:hypothetical protein CLIB1423_20S00100 [[Candida] railenensis]|uniref:Smr domain-containing protein n=1 Tax=[Candida] railenensis TaxID=45579 RepID=A0A9P0QTX4_9ASCO|nr:hypothetical protein CLIB1423_20S00100 [[Candida] railenensis]
MSDKFHKELFFPKNELKSNENTITPAEMGIPNIYQTTSLQPRLWIELTPMIRVPISCNEIRDQVFQALEEIHLGAFLHNSGPISNEFVELLSNPISFQDPSMLNDLHPVVYYLAGLTRESLIQVVGKLTDSSPISIILSKVNGIELSPHLQNKTKEYALTAYSDFARLNRSNAFLSKLYDLVSGNELYFVTTLVICTLHAFIHMFEPAKVDTFRQKEDDVQERNNSQSSSDVGENILNTIHQMRLNDYLDTKISEIESNGQFREINADEYNYGHSSLINSPTSWASSNATENRKSIWDNNYSRLDSPFTPEFLTAINWNQPASDFNAHDELQKASVEQEEKNLGSEQPEGMYAPDEEFSAHYQIIKSGLFGSIYNLFGNKNIVPIKELLRNKDVIEKIDRLTDLLVIREMELEEGTIEESREVHEAKSTDTLQDDEAAQQNEKNISRKLKVLKISSKKEEQRPKSSTHTPTLTPSVPSTLKLEQKRESNSVPIDQFSNAYHQVSQKLSNKLDNQTDTENFDHTYKANQKQIVNNHSKEFSGLNETNMKSLREFSKKWAEKHDLKDESDAGKEAINSPRDVMTPSSKISQAMQGYDSIINSTKTEKSNNITTEIENEELAIKSENFKGGVGTNEVGVQQFDHDSMKIQELSSNIDIVQTLFPKLKRNTTEEMFKMCYFDLDAVLDLLFSEELALDATISIVLENISEQEMSFEEQYLFAIRYFPKLTRSELSSKLSMNMGNFKHTLQRLYFDNETYFDASSTVSVNNGSSESKREEPEVIKIMPEVGVLQELLPNVEKEVLMRSLKRYNFDVNKAYESLAEVQKSTNSPPAESTDSSWKKFDVDATKVQEITHIPMKQVKSYLHKNKGNYLETIVDIILNYKHENTGNTDSNVLKGGRVQYNNISNKTTPIEVVTDDPNSEEYKYDPHSKEAQELRAVYLGNKEFRENMSETFFTRGLVFFKGDYSQVLNVAFLLWENNSLRLSFATPQKKNKLSIVLDEINGGIKLPDKKLPVKVKATEGRSAIPHASGMSYNGSEQLDLHGMTSKDAVNKAEYAVKKWWALESEQRIADGRMHKFGSIAQFCSPLSIIVGKGIHSTGGRAKIKPAVTKMLERNRYVFEDSSGALVVLGKR